MEVAGKEKNIRKKGKFSNEKRKKAQKEDPSA